MARRPHIPSSTVGIVVWFSRDPDFRLDKSPRMRAIKMIFIEPIQSLTDSKNHQGVINMRRTAAVALTAITLGAGVGLTAVPANAAPARKATKSWSTFHGKKGSIWRTIQTKGKYTRNGGKITINGWLYDTKKNGWSPAVEFRVWRDGKWNYSKMLGVKYRSSGLPADGKIKYNFGQFWSTTGTHLQVREIANKAGSKTSFKRSKSWKKLF